MVGWQDSLPPNLASQLDSFGIALLVSETQTLDRWIDSSRAIESALEVSQGVSQQWADALSRLREQYADRQAIQSVWLLWDRPLMVAGGSGYLNELMTLCGGVNPFGDINLAAPSIDPEALIRSAPDMLIGTSNGFDAFEDYPSIPAIRDQALWSPPPNLLARPGPSLVQGTQQLCHAIDERRRDLAQNRL